MATHRFIMKTIQSSLSRWMGCIVMSMSPATRHSPRTQSTTRTSQDATNNFTKRPTNNDTRPKQVAGLEPSNKASISVAQPIPTGWSSLYLHQTARIYQPWNKGRPYEWCLPTIKESKESSNVLVSEECSPDIHRLDCSTSSLIKYLPVLAKVSTWPLPIMSPDESMEIMTCM
jgi:hypothetical protein